MTDTDIVTRLRDCTCVPHGELCREAADEIERLRHELDGTRLAYRGSSYDRDRMRAERDEAKERNVRLLSKLQEYEVREL